MRNVWVQTEFAYATWVAGYVCTPDRPSFAAG